MKITYLLIGLLILNLNLGEATSINDDLDKAANEKETSALLAPGMGSLPAQDLSNHSEEEVINKASQLLDKTFEVLSNFKEDKNQLSHTLVDFVPRLNEVRLALSKESIEKWHAFTKIARKHPIHKLLCQDLLTRRAFEKPRGYAGDAIMLDYIYYGVPSSEKVTDLGRTISDIFTSFPIMVADRNRAVIIGRTIDDIAHNKKNVRVLSIACGHARDASTSKAFMNNKLEEFVAFDQDAESLQQVMKEYARYANIIPIHGSVKNLLKGDFHNKLGLFDFVYAAGLFDYLNKQTATKLVEIMFSLTKPDGLVYITNFLPNINTRGYMESMMDWYLIYRDLKELEDLARTIPLELIGEKRLFRESRDNVGFLELKKKFSTYSSIVRAKL